MNKLLIIVAAVVLTACQSQPKSLYNWGDYQESVYNYYHQDKSSPQEQIAALQKTQQQAQAKNTRLPPGFHAHLGMLYATTGQDLAARQQFETEKSLYPESTTFMNFLLAKKGEQG